MEMEMEMGKMDGSEENAYTSVVMGCDECRVPHSTGWLA